MGFGVLTHLNGLKSHRKPSRCDRAYGSGEAVAPVVVAGAAPSE